MSTPVIVPNAPSTFDAESFRLKLAGLTDPDYSGSDDNSTVADYKRHAVDLCVCLCEVFGDKGRGGPLDRMTLWDRIESALRTAAAKIDDGSIDRLLSLCIEHVHGVGYARSIRYLGLLALADKPLSWRQGFVRYIDRHVPAVLGHAVRMWEQVKDERRDVRAMREGGTLSSGEIVEKGGKDQ